MHLYIRNIVRIIGRCQVCCSLPTVRIAQGLHALIPCGLNQDTHNEDVGGAACSSSRYDTGVLLSHLQLAKASLSHTLAA